MNEDRRNKREFFGQTKDPLKDKWDALLSRLFSLYRTADAMLRRDICVLIGLKINAMQKNKPNKSVYRSILKFADDIDSKLQGDKGRTR